MYKKQGQKNTHIWIKSAYQLVFFCMTLCDFFAI